MTTSLLDRIPVDEITARGHAARPGRVLLTLVLGLGFLIGWLPGKLWYLLADFTVAIGIGFRRGAGWPPAQPPEAPGG